MDDSGRRAALRCGRGHRAGGSRFAPARRDGRLRSRRVAGVSRSHGGRGVRQLHSVRHTGRGDGHRRAARRDELSRTLGSGDWRRVAHQGSCAYRGSGPDSRIRARAGRRQPRERGDHGRAAGAAGGEAAAGSRGRSGAGHTHTRSRGGMGRRAGSGLSARRRVRHGRRRHDEPERAGNPRRGGRRAVGTCHHTAEQREYRARGAASRGDRRQDGKGSAYDQHPAGHSRNP